MTGWIGEEAARLAALPHDEAKAAADELVASQSTETAALLARLIGQHAVDSVKVEHEKRRATDAIFEASRYGLLWNSAAACLQHNRSKLAKPRGGDERRMLAHIDTAHGPISNGSTDGWLDWLPDPDTAGRITLVHIPTPVDGTTPTQPATEEP